MDFGIYSNSIEFDLSYKYAIMSERFGACYDNCILFSSNSVFLRNLELAFNLSGVANLRTYFKTADDGFADYLRVVIAVNSGKPMVRQTIHYRVSFFVVR